MKEFSMKDLRKTKIIIGWEITREEGILKIDPKGYIRDFLKSEGMTSCYLIVLPVKAGSTLILKQIGDHSQDDFIAYQQLMGKLIYPSFETRPDITIVVGQLSCQNSNSRAGYLCIAKQVLFYFKGIITLDFKWRKDFVSY